MTAWATALVGLALAAVLIAWAVGAWLDASLSQALDGLGSAENDAPTGRTQSDDPSVFIGSAALLTALHDAYVEHIGIIEPDGPDGPYLWCVCGWRSDDLDGHGTRSDNPGLSYAIHLTNAQHAAAVKALQPIVRRIPPGRDAIS